MLPPAASRWGVKRPDTDPCIAKGPSPVGRTYVFADESGNFDFRDPRRFPGATMYFAVGTILLNGQDDRRRLERDLLDLRHEMVDEGLPFTGECHATEDKQVVRDRVFDVLSRHTFTVDVTVVEKAHVPSELRTSEAVFYQHVWFHHFDAIARKTFTAGDDVTVLTATLGTKAKQRTSGDGRSRALIEDKIRSVNTVHE